MARCYAPPCACGPPVVLSPALKRWGDGRGCVASVPTCGPLLISPPLPSVGDPLDGRGYVANPPNYGPLLFSSPALKRWGPPRRRG